MAVMVVEMVVVVLCHVQHGSLPEKDELASSENVDCIRADR